MFIIMFVFLFKLKITKTEWPLSSGYKKVNYYQVSQKKRYLNFKTRSVFHQELMLGNERKCLC